MEKKTILIIDQVTERTTYLMALLEQQHHITIAQSGQAALELFKQQPQPDLILLEGSLEDRDAYALCKEIRDVLAMISVPIVFVTEAVTPEEINKVFEAGASDYIIRPYQVSELMARVETQLVLKEKTEKMELMANKLEKYLSPEVYNSIFTKDKDVKVQTTKKFLTVCFTDVVDFTAKSENMDVDDLRTWLNRYMSRMAEITTKYGGTLDKFIGDSVMIFFGDPKSKGHERDAIACAEMAKAMVAEASNMNIRIRIGINSGECIVGSFGSENRMDYTIIGKEVNSAQRLETNSEASKILISENTYHLIKDKINCHQGGEIQVKGLERMLSTYWID